MLIDLHTHSINSPDASDRVVKMCERAVELGLSAYAITDHVEAPKQWWYNITDSGEKEYIVEFNTIFENSLSDIEKAKDIFGGKLNLLCGVELGQPIQNMELAKKYSSDKRLDFIIGSNHEVTGYEDFFYLDFSTIDVSMLITKYFDEIYAMSKNCDFDSLGHLTYFLRYMTLRGVKNIDLSPYEEIIRASFKLLAQRGMGIEINTSGLRQAYGKPFPDYDYVKMFKDEGGECLTIGSDAHNINDIGKNIGDGIEIAKRAGFEYICYFKERKPQFIKI